jgi:hypothetical protein
MHLRQIRTNRTLLCFGLGALLDLCGPKGELAKEVTRYWKSPGLDKGRWDEYEYNGCLMHDLLTWVSDFKHDPAVVDTVCDILKTLVLGVEEVRWFSENSEEETSMRKNLLNRIYLHYLARGREPKTYKSDHTEHLGSSWSGKDEDTELRATPWDLVAVMVMPANIFYQGSLATKYDHAELVQRITANKYHLANFADLFVPCLDTYARDPRSVTTLISVILEYVRERHETMRDRGLFKALRKVCFYHRHHSRTQYSVIMVLHALARKCIHWRTDDELQAVRDIVLCFMERFPENKIIGLDIAARHTQLRDTHYMNPPGRASSVLPVSSQ